MNTFEELSELFALASLVVWYGLTSSDNKLMLTPDEGTRAGAQVASDEGSKETVKSKSHIAHFPRLFLSA